MAALIIESAAIVGGLTWAVEKVLEHTVGATGYELTREFVRGAVRELGDPQKSERNHDIARAVRGAQLDALEAVLDGFAILNAPRWDQQPDSAANQFLERAAEFCRGARRQLKDEEFKPDFAPRSALTASIEGLLADQPVHTAADDYGAAFGTFAEEAVLDELGRALEPVLVPDAFAPYLRGGAGRGHPRFLDLFGAGIATRLKDKDDTRFRDILQTSWLADLKGLGFETTEILASVEAQFGGLLSDVHEIRQMLREIVDRLAEEVRLSNADRMALAADLAKAKTELNGTNDLVAGFLETMLGRKVSPDRFAATLFAMVADLRKADAQIDALTFSRNLSPQLEPMLARAKAARDAGRLDELTAALADITRMRRAAREQLEAYARELGEELRLRRRAEADSAAAEGALARARLAYREAAAHYLAAAEVLSANDDRGAWDHIMEAAGALYSQGEEFGDNAALAEAIQLYRDKALPRSPRPDRPLDWAMTQMHLGNALARIGEREIGTARLEAAVSAYREALKVYTITREQAPLEWGITQQNIGNTLRMIAERESGTARLEEAVGVLQSALQELTRERAPLRWAMAQDNLGNALSELGERERMTVRLEQAVAAHREALKEYTRERAKLQWAETQNNLGNALAKIGALQPGATQLEAAVGAYREALEVFTREQVPLDWAMAQTNLGLALLSLAERETGTARLRQAEAAFRAALKEYTPKRTAIQWATTQMSLGTTLAMLGERDSSAALLKEAIAAYDPALRILEIAAHRFAETCRTNRALALAALDRMNTLSQPFSSTKVGRNDPCPCGSGKKYKNCHGSRKTHLS